MDNTCSHCGNTLPIEHTGPCPRCGETAKYVELSASTKLTGQTFNKPFRPKGDISSGIIPEIREIPYLLTDRDFDILLRRPILPSITGGFGVAGFIFLLTLLAKTIHGEQIKDFEITLITLIALAFGLFLISALIMRAFGKHGRKIKEIKKHFGAQEVSIDEQKRKYGKLS